MKELLPGIFAVEVPEDAKNVAIKNGTYVKWITIDGNPFTPLNDPGKFRALFTTKDCIEEQAGSVVGCTMAGLFEHYGCMWDLSGFEGFNTATESLQSLLRSHNLTGKNYLLIKKQP